MNTNCKQQHIVRNSNFTAINNESENGRMIDNDSEKISLRRNSNSQGNLLFLINEVRSHIKRQATLGGGPIENVSQQQRRFMHSASDSAFTSSNAANSTNRSRYTRSWRMNLNNVLSMCYTMINVANWEQHKAILPAVIQFFKDEFKAKMMSVDIRLMINNFITTIDELLKDLPDELGVNRDRYKSLADEMDSTFAELAGY
uniref:Uncharacterized protein n=1 Tax=Glossina pallidipes TaxID=7398 RepID=A0A1A9ZDT6_GLOPL